MSYQGSFGSRPSCVLNLCDMPVWKQSHIDLANKRFSFRAYGYPRQAVDPVDTFRQSHRFRIRCEKVLGFSGAPFLTSGGVLLSLLVLLESFKSYSPWRIDVVPRTPFLARGKSGFRAYRKVQCIVGAWGSGRPVIYWRRLLFEQLKVPYDGLLCLVSDSVFNWFLNRIRFQIWL